VATKGPQAVLKINTFRDASAAPARPARSSPENGRPAVCLVSGHPAVIFQLGQAIKKNRFRVLSERFAPSPLTGQPRFALPAADLYVVDGLAPRAASAMMVQQILDANPGASVLLVGEKGAEEECFDLLALGARGLLTYDEVPGQLQEALKCLAAGGFWLSPLRLARFMAQLRRGRRMKPAVAPLSRRQQEILEKLARNLSNKEIAHELNISERTVKFHVSNLLEKFQVRGRMELALACCPGTRFGFPAAWQEPAHSAAQFSKAEQQPAPRVFPAPKQDRGLLRTAQTRRPFASVS
jgi:DNA-binding NarL/FixJ family response regulator